MATRQNWAWDYQEDICEEYLDGTSATQLGVEYETSSGIILRILRANNIRIRTLKESHVPACKRLSIWDWDADEVLDLWDAGNITTKELGEIFDCHQDSIRRMLNENGRDTSRRTNNNSYGHEEAICNQYLAGATIKFLYQKYSCSPPTIRKVLTDNGIEIRKKGTYKRKPKPKRK